MPRFAHVAITATAASILFLGCSGSSGTSSGGGTAVCPSLTPDRSSPTGTLTGLSGQIAYSNVSGSFDFGALVDGLADPFSGGLLIIYLTSYPEACGTRTNHIVRGGVTTITLTIPIAPGPVSTGAVAPADIGVDASLTKQEQGLCTRLELVPLGFASTGTGAIITALDSAHVAGSFDLTPPGGSRVTGTFDVPFCAGAPTGKQQCCEN